MEDKEANWDEYIEGTLFTINTNESTTTKYTPFFLMFGRNPRLPFEVEKMETPLAGSDGIEELMKDLNNEENTNERVTQMSQMRDSVFPVVDRNIQQAQEKQKQQYLKRKGHVVCPFKVGDLVLQRNMLQKTKAGHKLEDQWLGPYQIIELNASRGVCKLSNRSGKKLTKQVSVKHLKPYLQLQTEPHPQLPLHSNNPSSQPQLAPPVHLPPPSLVPQTQPCPQIPLHSNNLSSQPQLAPPVHLPPSLVPQTQPCLQIPLHSNNPSSQPQLATKTPPVHLPPSLVLQTQPCLQIPLHSNNLSSQPQLATKTPPVHLPPSLVLQTQPCLQIPLHSNNPSSKPQLATKTPPVHLPPSLVPQRQPCPQLPLNSNNQSSEHHLATKTPPVPKPRMKLLLARSLQKKPIPLPRVFNTTNNPAITPCNVKRSKAEAKPNSEQVSRSSLPPLSDDQCPAKQQQPALYPVRTSSIKLNTDDLTACDKKVDNLQQNDLKQLVTGIKGDLNGIITGRAKSWRFEAFSTGSYGPNIKKSDLPFNVYFGGFNDQQQDVILSQLQEDFPTEDRECLMKVLLPEALILICRDALKIPYDRAEDYLQNGGQQHVKDLMDTLKMKAIKQTTKKRQLQSQPRKEPAKKIKIEHSLKDTSEQDDCILVKEQPMDENAIMKMKRPCYKLQEGDKEIITKNGWLTDNIIGKAQNLLKEQFPGIKGFQSTTLGVVGQFDIMKSNFIQVLHTGASHWVCISNIGCSQDNAVNLYDSMYTGVKKFTKKQIAGILHIQSCDEMVVFVKPVTHQSNGHDCGVYAIAFATALCYGYDPSMLMFKRRDIRNHLWKCLTQEKLDMFPSKAIRSPLGPSKRLRVPIYCDCRLPFDWQDDDMAECSKCCKWYHKKCQKVPAKVFQRKQMQWKCKLCVAGRLQAAAAPSHL